MNKIKKLIKIKNSKRPLYCVYNDIKKQNTDHDHFPYTRYFRSDVTSNVLTISDRKSGYYNNFKSCYIPEKINTENNIKYPEHCFESSCVLNKPCFKENADRFAAFNKLNNLLNDSCVINER